MQPTNPFPNLWLRIGPFHLQKIIIEILGQYLSGYGIEEIIVHDLELYGENTYKGILNGSHCNRGTRLHKIIYESIRTIQIFEYVQSCDYSDLKEYLEIPEYDSLRKAIIDGDKTKLHAIIRILSETKKAEQFFNNFESFLMIKYKENQVFAYFNKHWEIVEIFLDSIRADRTGDYDLHLSSTTQILPYLFATNHPFTLEVFYCIWKICLQHQLL